MLTRVELEGPLLQGDSVYVRVIISPKNLQSFYYSYRFSVDCLDRFNYLSDAYLISSIFLLMKLGHNVYINGTVTKSLLENIDRFQEIWSTWRPEIYKKVDIYAASEIEDKTTNNNSAITLFSGGIDSAFATLKHNRKEMGRLNKEIKAGIMVSGMGGFQHGADANWSNIEYNNISSLLKQIGIAPAFIETDWQNCMEACGLDIYEIFTTGFISCLHILSSGTGYGIIGSDDTIRNWHFETPRASSPLTDGLLSSNSFKIINEGNAFSRVSKIKYLNSWAEYLKILRICNNSHRTNRNCGKCEKCIRTSLAFHVAGIEVPDGIISFEMCEIETIEIRSKPVLLSLKSLILDAKLAGLENENWCIRLENHLAQFE